MNIRRNFPGLVILFWASIFCFASTDPAAADTSRLTSVRLIPHSGELEAVIRVEGTFEHTFFELTDPPRLVVDLIPVQEVTAPGNIPVQAFGVERIRTGQPQPGTARVVFEFSERKPFYLINITPDGIQVSFLSGTSGQKKETPKPFAGPPTVREPTPPAVPKKENKPPSSYATLIGLNLENMALADKRFQDVFGHGTKASLSIDLCQVLFSSGRLALAFGAEYQRLSLTGQSTVTGQATQVSIAPLNLGLRFIFRAGNVWPYVSSGLAVYHFREQSSLRDTMGYTTGVSLGGGIYVGTPSFRLLKAKAFLQWTRVIAEENGLRVNLGGLEVGAGLALEFSLF